MATKLETLRANADARLDALIEQNSMNVPFDTLCAIDFDDHTEADIEGFMRVMFGPDWNNVPEEVTKAMELLASYDRGNGNAECSEEEIEAAVEVLENTMVPGALDCLNDYYY